MMSFPLFLCECEKNGKLLMCESRYDFPVFIFVFDSDDPIIYKSENIHEGYIKKCPFQNIDSLCRSGIH